MNALRVPGICVLSGAPARQACGPRYNTQAPQASRESAQAGLAPPVDASCIISADATRDQWLTHGRSYDEQRFSPLDQSNRNSVFRVDLPWYVDQTGGPTHA